MAGKATLSMDGRPTTHNICHVFMDFDNDVFRFLSRVSVPSLSIATGVGDARNSTSFLA